MSACGSAKRPFPGPPWGQGFSRLSSLPCGAGRCSHPSGRREARRQQRAVAERSHPRYRYPFCGGRGAPPKDGEVRGGVPEGLRRCPGGAGQAGGVLRLLQFRSGYTSRRAIGHRRRVRLSYPTTLPVQTMGSTSACHGVPFVQSRRIAFTEEGDQPSRLHRGGAPKRLDRLLRALAGFPIRASSISSSRSRTRLRAEPTSPK